MKSLLFVGICALAACAANASPPAAVAEAPAAYVTPMSTPVSASRDVSCDIIRTRTSRGIELRAVASSDFNATGEYEFTITKHDRSGSSDIMQSGEFQLVRGESASLGSAEVSVARGGGFHARLELTDTDGVACVAEEGR